MKQGIIFNDPIEEIKSEIYYTRGNIVTAHISDLHFPVMDSKTQYEILEDQFISKLINMPWLDIICINGDLFDHKVTTSSDATLYASMFVSRLVDIAKMKNATLIILQGTISHDANQLKIYYHYMQRSDVDVRIVTTVQFQYVKNTKILCIPELYGFPEEEYQKYLFYSGPYDFAIMHGTIKGAVYGDNVGQGRLFTIDDFINCRGPIISGHVHKPGVFSDHFYYCGSPYRWRFDDDHFKGFILMMMNLDTREYITDYEEITSFVYRTITMKQLVSNDPKDTVQYIRDLKFKEGIDFIKIKFINEVSLSDKMILNNVFRDDNSVTLEYKTIEEKIKQETEQNVLNDQTQFSFLVDPNYTDQQKFVMWVNYLKHDETFMTIEQLEQMLIEEV